MCEASEMFRDFLFFITVVPKICSIFFSNKNLYIIIEKIEVL